MIAWICILSEEKCSDVGLCVTAFSLICNFCVDVQFALEQCISTDLWSDQRNHEEFWFTDHVTWKSHLHAAPRLLNVFICHQSNHNMCQPKSYVDWQNWHMDIESHVIIWYSRVNSNCVWFVVAVENVIVDIFKIYCQQQMINVHFVLSALAVWLYAPTADLKYQPVVSK